MFAALMPPTSTLAAAQLPSPRTVYRMTRFWKTPLMVWDAHTYTKRLVAKSTSTAMPMRPDSPTEVTPMLMVRFNAAFGDPLA
jgi:hypothetical protein